jgi:hypothetical protein
MDTPDELRAAAHIEHLHSLSRHPAYGPAYAPDYYAESIGQARERLWASMDDDDIGGEVFGDDLVKLVHAGDPNAIGRFVLSRMNAWADRLAERAVS